MLRTLQLIVVAGTLFGLVQSASAQQRAWEDRVFAGISFGGQSASNDFGESTTFRIYDENGTLVSNASFDSGAIFDITGGVRAWRNLGIGIAYHNMNEVDGTGDVQGSVPHPLFFDRPRTFTQPVDGLKRSEHATHLMFGWMVPINDKFDVFAYGGPSFFRLTQDVIAGVAITEQGPPFTAVNVQPSVETRKESANGFNIGVDGTYIFYTSDSIRLGVGGFFRYASASANINLANETAKTDIGGAQFAVGARIRY